MNLQNTRGLGGARLLPSFLRTNLGHRDSAGASPLAFKKELPA